MTEVTLEQMMDAGAHFGHQTRRWNPKMKPYLYGVRSGIHIIDLGQTFHLIKKAHKAVEDIVVQGHQVLFVGTKESAQAPIEEAAQRAGMPYVTRRWLGGMLTNFATIRRSVERLIELETRREKNDFAGYTKKELLGVDREIKRLLVTLGGIKTMRKLPGAVFVVDPMIEKIAVHEAKILGIPVIAILDSNCNPDSIDYLIPANDDSMRSIQLFTSQIAEACLAGVERRQAMALEEGNKREEGKKRRVSTDLSGHGKAYGAKHDTYEEDEEVKQVSMPVAAPEERIAASQEAEVVDEDPLT